MPIPFLSVLEKFPSQTVFEILLKDMAMKSCVYKELHSQRVRWTNYKQSLTVPHLVLCKFNANLPEEKKKLLRATVNEMK